MVVETVVEKVVKTVDATTTVWVSPGQTPTYAAVAQKQADNQQGPKPVAAPSTTSTSTPPPPPTTTSTPAPIAAYQAPTTTSTSTTPPRPPSHPPSLLLFLHQAPPPQLNPPALRVRPVVVPARTVAHAPVTLPCTTPLPGLLLKYSRPLGLVLAAGSTTVPRRTSLLSLMVSLLIHPL